MSIHRICRKASCNNLTDNRQQYCKQHQYIYEEKKILREKKEKERLTQLSKRSKVNYPSRKYGKLYNTYKWRKERKLFLSINRYCLICRRMGRVVEAKVIDHIIPHKGQEELFWDKSNWQPLCKSCNSRKAVREEGGLGRAIRTNI